MYVLGIETSCDETSAAVVKDGKRILSNIVVSSLKFHRKYGGVVPEIAFRMQLETIAQVAEGAIKEAGIKLKEIGLVSVTSGPGLSGSLVVGVSFAKALALSLRIPLLGVNHLYGHIYANFLQPQKRKIKNGAPPQVKPGVPSAAESRLPTILSGRRDNAAKTQKFCGFAKLPFVALVVSGGHTSLFFVRDFDDIALIGATLDDASGEAFDKVAKILGLGYPGGPLIERMAQRGNPREIKFSCAQTKKPLDFSFSGIKTAVLYYVRRLASSPVSRLSNRQMVRQSQHPWNQPEQSPGAGKQANRQTRDVAASFQETVIGALIKKSLLACRIKKTKHLVIGGGVAVNNRLREKFAEAAKKEGLKIYFPEAQLCLDNAAMVAGLGYRLFKKGYRSDLGLNVELN